MASLMSQMANMPRYRDVSRDFSGGSGDQGIPPAAITQIQQQAMRDHPNGFTSREDEQNYYTRAAHQMGYSFDKHKEINRRGEIVKAVEHPGRKWAVLAPAIAAGAAFGAPALFGALGAGGGAGAGVAAAEAGGLVSPVAGATLTGSMLPAMASSTGLSMPGLLKTGGTLLGGMGKGLADNRNAELGGQFAQQTTDIARAGEDRTERGDLWKKLNEADYMMQRTPYDASKVTLPGYGSAPTINGLPSFGTARPASSPEALEGAKALRDEALRRLKEGSTLPKRPNLNLTRPGGVENLLNYGGMGLSLANQFLR